MTEDTDFTQETQITQTQDDVTTPSTSDEATTQEVSDTQGISQDEAPQEAVTEETAADETRTGTENYEERYKNLQAEFTRATQQLSEVQKQVEAMATRNAIVESSTGTIRPEIVRQYAQELAMGELSEYRNAIHRLEPDIQAEVSQLLSNYQATGDPTLLNQAKNYFDSGFVSEVERLKVQRAFEIENYLKGEQERTYTEAKSKFSNGIKAEAPRAYEYINPQSKFYSKELAEAIGNAAGHISPAEVEETVKNIERIIIERNKADALLSDKIRKEASALKPPQVTANIVSTGLPTYEQVEKMSQAEYDAAYAKYGDKLLESALK